MEMKKKFPQRETEVENFFKNVYLSKSLQSQCFGYRRKDVLDMDIFIMPIELQTVQTII